MDRASYLLGILDGEGSVSALKNGRGRTTRVSVQMCSHDICLMLKQQWGGACSEIKRKTSLGRTMWTWDATGKTAVPVLEYMAEHSLLKGEQARLGLLLIQTLSQGNNNQWGRDGMPKEIIEAREGLARRISALNRGQTPSPT